MDKLIDFSNAPKLFRTFGGSDQKIAVMYEEKVYMLKFAQFHAKHTDMSTSYVNSVISEYICSHITETIGLPVHKTVLGLYGKNKGDGSFDTVLVVGCEDFRKDGDINAEFSEFLRAEFRTDEIKRVVRLDQIYQVLNDRSYFSEQLAKQSIERYWDTFVVDALVGNFDRHPGNWGYLFNKEVLRIAPIYDFCSCLLPQLSDDGIDAILNNEFELLKRCYVFPSPALYITKEKTGKIGYYDMLSSNYDENCIAALLRIAPKISEKKVDEVIDATPLISEKRKRFYKKYLRLRKRVIIDKAFSLCETKEYDKAAMRRLLEGNQYSEDLLKQKMKDGEIHLALDDFQ